MKTLSYNAACYKMRCMYGDNIEVKDIGEPCSWAKIDYYHNGQRVAHYDEETGLLNVFREPAARGMCATVNGPNYDAETYAAEGAILARQESWGIYD